MVSELYESVYIQYRNQIVQLIERDSFVLFFPGICVLFDVDATKLEECLALRSKLFNKIIFNFPHVGGKMRIEKNRELLKNFFVSSQKMIKENGQVLVTLCNGQGGTPMDNPKRRWDDSWKIVEMAAHGNFILTKIEPFLWQSFQDFVVTGYRSLEKQFHTAGSLTHFFVKSEPPTIYNIIPSNKLDISKYNINNITWKEITNNIENKSVYNVKCIYPCTFIFDLTLSTDMDFNTAEFYQSLYNYVGIIIDNIEFINYYLSPIDKKIKRTCRITYKSNYIPLYKKRVIGLHQNVITNFIEDNFQVTISR